MLVNKLTSGPNIPVQFYLFTRPDKQGDHPINVSISLFGERLCTSVGYAIALDKWDDKTQRVKKNAYNSKKVAYNLINFTKLLKNLCDKGFLISYGFGRGTKYQINEEYELSSLKNDDSKGVSKGVIKGVRSSSEKVKKDILEVCSDYASIEEIAAKVGKSIAYLKNKIIPQMLADGLLEWQYPNAPRHPFQKYRAKK